MVAKFFNFGQFVKEFRQTYFGNPIATRDLRVQLRGNRSVILFSIYLILMTVILLLAYDGAVGMQEGGRSLAFAQDSLQSFYYTTQGCLAAIVVLVAPAIGSFAVVLEKQRRSIDLIFTAPVEPRTYFVGKLLSTYRFVWLLLILSLPFCAVSVTLGGVTWSQLFVTFLLYSFFGLVCVAIGLLISTVCEKLTQALIYTYLAVAGYVFVLTILLAQGYLGRGATVVAPIQTLHPFLFGTLAEMKTNLGPIEVPAWVMSIVMQLLVVKLLILGAGTALSPSDSKNPLKLRTYGLVYLAAVFYLLGQSNDSIVRPIVSGYSSSGSGLTTEVASGRLFCGFLFFFTLLFVPFLSTFGNDALKRSRFDGWFKIRNIFRPVPSGSLPYVLCLYLTCLVGYALGANSGGLAIPFRGTTTGTSAFSWQTVVNLDFAQYVLMAISLGVMTHSIGFLGSSKRQVIAQGRSAALVITLLVLLIPSFILFTYAATWGKLPSAWYFTQVGTLADSTLNRIPLALSVVHVVLTVIFARIAIRRSRPAPGFQLPV